MELIIIAILAVLMPIFTISAFVIGYNMHADRKIRIAKPKKNKALTADEEMLQRIESATVFKTEK